MNRPLDFPPVTLASYTPAAFLEAFVDTNLPGCRRIDIGATSITLTAGYYSGQDFYAQVNTDVLAATSSAWEFALQSHGFGELAGTGSEVITWPDWLGWLLGYGVDPGHVEASADTLGQRYVSPALIPLLGYQWESVDLERESEAETDRMLRSHFYLWGKARVWRWLLTMDRYSFQALQAGWALRGKVRLRPNASTGTLGSGDTDGEQVGYILGLESAQWIGPTDTSGVVSVSLLVVGVGT